MGRIKSWDDSSFTEGGMKAITKFRGKLTDLEEGVEGTYGLQVREDFIDVEVLECTDPNFELEGDELSDWMKDSPKKSGLKHRAFMKMKEFAQAQNMGPVPSCFEDLDLIWERQEFDFGEGMSPGRAFIPVALGEGFVASDSDDDNTDDSDDSGTVELSDVEIPDAIRDLIVEVVGDDGATGDTVKRAVIKKKKIRTLVDEFGGHDFVLKALVEQGILVEDEGVFIVV